MKLLITGAASFSPSQLRHLESMGCTISYVEDERIPLEQQKESIDPASFEGVITNALFLYNSIDAFKSLRMIQLTSAGLDRVPLDYIKEHNICLFNAWGVYSVPMAEFALAGVLQLYKHMQTFYEMQKQNTWHKDRTLKELAGNVVCIFGCGSVGTECAKRFQAMGCRVVGIDLCPRCDASYERILPLQNTNDLLRQASVVVNALPLTPDTKHFFDEKRLHTMRSDAVLVNIGRGATVDTAALEHALETKKLAGAVLDVFEEEPLPANSTLWGRENVILTPHNSFVSPNNSTRLFKRACYNIKSYMATRDMAERDKA